MRREVGDPQTRGTPGNRTEPTQAMPGREHGRTAARYPCRTCGEGFRYQHELDKHEREQHPAEAPPDAPIGQL